jgi:hypothetical protein
VTSAQVSKNVLHEGCWIQSDAAANVDHAADEAAAATPTPASCIVDTSVLLLDEDAAAAIGLPAARIRDCEALVKSWTHVQAIGYGVEEYESRTSLHRDTSCQI